jgi:hypothetical protein
VRRLEMDIEFKIRMPQPTVRGAAQILGSLALMREGVRLMVNDGYEEFTRELSRVASGDGKVPMPPGYPALLLEQAGEVVLYKHDWPVLSPPDQLFLTQAMLQIRPRADDLQLVRVGAGSLDGVIKDALDVIGGFVRGLFDSTNSITRGGEGGDLKEAVRAIADVRPEGRARALGAGVVMIGAESLRLSYEANGVLGVDV